MFSASCSVYDKTYLDNDNGFLFIEFRDTLSIVDRIPIGKLNPLSLNDTILGGVAYSHLYLYSIADPLNSTFIGMYDDFYPIEAFCLKDSILFLFSNNKLNIGIFSQDSSFTELSSTVIDKSCSRIMIIDSIILLITNSTTVSLYKLNQDYSINYLYEINYSVIDAITAYEDILIISADNDVTIYSINNDSLIVESYLPGISGAIKVSKNRMACKHEFTVSLLDISNIQNPFILNVQSFPEINTEDFHFSDSTLIMVYGEWSGTGTYVCKYVYNENVGFIPQGIYSDNNYQSMVFSLDEFFGIYSSNGYLLLFEK